MKFSFSLKNKEVNLEADVERLVEKNLDYKAANPDKKTKYQIKQEEKRKTEAAKLEKKTKYQIKQEEKRKTEAAKHKRQMQYLYIMIGLIVLFVIIAIIASVLGI